MKRELTCIQCPIGCRLAVEHGREIIEVAGNRCEKGKEYAEREITNPTRSLCSTVRTCFPDFPLLPVRTDGEVPLGSIFAVMDLVKIVEVKKRLRPGDVVVEKLPGSGVSLIATADMLDGGGTDGWQADPFH